MTTNLTIFLKQNNLFYHKRNKNNIHTLFLFIRNQAENFCNQPLSVRCGDKLTCISHLELCDGKFDCPDMSDEQYSGPGFKCVINSVAAPTCVLPQINLYDNQSHCYFDADLCFDSDGLLTSDCFLCLDGNHVSNCNGVYQVESNLFLGLR